MLDWLLGLRGTLPHFLSSATITGNFSETPHAEDRGYGAAVSPYTHHHDYHPHIHNETHYHIITYLNGTVSPVNYTHSHYHGYNHHSGYGDGLGLTSALSSWYQLNMGLIGIGALAVVAIIGSRNFFGNYLTIKKNPYGYEGYGYDMYGTGYGGGGGYNRRSWYDEWYDYWYGAKNQEVYDPYKNGGPEYDRNQDPYSRDPDPDARTDYDPRTRPRDDGKKYHSRYRRSTSDSADRSPSDNNTETNSTLDNGQEIDSEYDSLNLPGNFDELNSTSFTEGDVIFEYLPEGPEGPVSPSEEELSVTHCGFRLICELSRQRKRNLTKDEWEILRLIKFSDLRMSAFPPGEGILPNHASLAAFKVAGRLGASGYPCDALKGKCPLQDDLIDGAAKQFFQIKQKKLKRKLPD